MPFFKKSFVLLLLSCLGPLPVMYSQVTNEIEPLIPLFNSKALKNGTLSPFWSQEFTGADLAREVVRELTRSGETQIVPIGVIDGGIDLKFFSGRFGSNLSSELSGQSADMADARPWHGTGVANLINGLPPIGMAESAEITSVSVKRTFKPNETEALQKMINKPVRLINLSLEIDQAPSESILRELSKQSILVASAGNGYPNVDANQIISRIPSIIVGSLGPDGLISALSSEGPSVSIAVPSDFYQLSVSESGTPSPFGQTSGATAMVTGALANVCSLLPSLSVEEALVLLKRSALHTLNSRQSPERNGAGSLNALRLIEIAKRLREGGWPSNRKRIFEDASLYNFSDTAEAALKQAKILLASKKPSDRKKGFHLLRRSFLLSEDAEAREMWASIYEKEGFLLNAQFLRNLDLATVRNYAIKQSLHLFPLKKDISVEDVFVAKAILRNSGIMGAQTMAVINEGINEFPAVALSAAVDLGEPGLPILISAAKSANKNFRLGVARNARYLKSDTALTLLNDFLTDPEERVRAEAAQSIEFLQRSKIQQPVSENKMSPSCSTVFSRMADK